MANSAESDQRNRKWLRALLAAGAILLLAVLLPPFVGVSRFKGQITNLISRSLGRPVRLSHVEVRILPWPGFVLSDLSVAEDPAYGAEPVLHANTVTASIRLPALWRGRVEIGAIRVDEASLNLVRAGPGRWNLDPLFRTAAAQTGPGLGAASPGRLPTLEATNSRIDFKNGVEKLPFSLVNADLTIWQENPDEWRIRLRGQPARTDVSLSLEDTGVLRMEASVRRGTTWRQMPVNFDLDWREAHLGQLARLVTGSDAGWRGDLTGQMHLEGALDTAQIALRLRASSVHREEFLPASPLDFDANCNFILRYTQRSLENLVCDSPLGGGRIHLTGEKPGPGAPPSFAVELNRIPVAAGLDLLRTLRSGLEPDLEAGGTVGGKLVYKEAGAELTAGEKSALVRKRSSRRVAKPVPEAPSPLTGSLTVEDLLLSGGGLTRPLQFPVFVLAPAAPESASSRMPAMPLRPATTYPRRALAGTVAVPAGGAVTLTLAMRFFVDGYQIAVHGQASIPRAKELAHAAGISEAAAFGSLAGDPLALDLVARGPWIPKEAYALNQGPPPEAAAARAGQSFDSSAVAEAAPEPSDTLAGTVTLRNANWTADYLANPLQLSEATLHLDSGPLRWDPVAFSYGPIKGTAAFTLAHTCPQAEQCPEQPPPTFSIQFGDLDAASFQAAMLGARNRGTLLSTLIDRLRPSNAPPWPRMRGTATAGSLVLGPVKLEKLRVSLDIRSGETDVASLQANLLGGQVKLTGKIRKPAADQDKLSYSLAGEFEKLDAKALGQLLGVRWSGSTVTGSGKVDLAGYTASDLAASAKGSLHIETHHGSIAALAKPQGQDETAADRVPDALGRFDRLTADATISDGAIALEQIQVVSGGRKQSATAAIPLANPLVVSFEPPKPAVAGK